MAFEIDAKGMCAIDGDLFPAVGFGTYPLQGNVCLQAVSQAAEIGYRIIDTATYYENFTPIQKALKDYPREQFYIISKVWPDSQTPQQLFQDFNRTLEQLKTNYLDAYLVHWPNSQVPIEDTLNAMEKLREQKVLRHIGLSNVTVNHLKRVLEINIPVYWVQVEMHPLFYDPFLVAFCQEHGIHVQAWGPLGQGIIPTDPFLIQLGEKYKKSAAQIAIKWVLQHHCLPLPGSKNKKHILENFQVNDFSLSHADFKQINERAIHGKRKRITKEMGIGFTDEFDYTYDECWPKPVHNA